MKNLFLLIIVIAVAAAAYVYAPQLIQKDVAMDDAARTEAGLEAARKAAPAPVATKTGTELMVGTWQSTSDPKFKREFRADGVMIDAYEGDASAALNASWRLARAGTVTIPSVITAFGAGKIVVEAEWEGGVEVTFFTIDAVSDTSLTIADLTGRGEITSFTKFK